jgi:hypothetical protein
VGFGPPSHTQKKIGGLSAVLVPLHGQPGRSPGVFHVVVEVDALAAQDDKNPDCLSNNYSLPYSSLKQDKGHV